MFNRDHGSLNQAPILATGRLYGPVQSHTITQVPGFVAYEGPCVLPLTSLVARLR